MPAKKTVDKNRAKATTETDKVEVKPPAKVEKEDADDKKRPRKPRGSKIVTKQQIAAISSPTIANVVLNLKCSIADLKEYNERLSKMISNPLEYNSSAPPEVKFYDGVKPYSALVASSSSSSNSDGFDPTACDARRPAGEPDGTNAFEPKSCAEENYSEDCWATTRINGSKITNSFPRDSATENWVETAREDVNTKEMMNKLKQLKIQLYKNSLHSEKKSACFWCTYDFDNSPCYIPKYEMDGTIYGYGSFCRPECAVAYLMKETIDDSTKFDRYHLLNQIYSKVYDCKKNIKPAPDPHFLLEKFYGNLTIQEYRKLLKTEHLLLVIDKPITRILPELHEDTDDAFTKIYGISPAGNGNATGVYKVKRQSEQPTGPTKASIIRSTFGLAN